MKKAVKKFFDNLKKDLKNLDKTIRRITKRSKKSYLNILIDIYTCYIKYSITFDEYEKLKFENEQYKEKIAQYEDWIYRLQEFMDMPNELRSDKFNECISKKNEDEAINNLIKKFGTYFNIF